LSSAGIKEIRHYVNGNQGLKYVLIKIHNSHTITCNYSVN